MKAKEYYEKYRHLLIAEAVDITGIERMSEDARRVVEEVINHQINRGIRECLFEMSMEVKSIIKQRNAKFDSAAVAVIREVNDRWNAMLSIMEKKGEPVLVKHDAVARYWISEIPALAKHLHIRKDEEDE